jgi:hypothetical protein
MKTSEPTSKPPRSLARHTIRCDHCGRMIDCPEAVRILRKYCALPEDCDTFRIHASCVPHFLDASVGQWESFLTSSPDAAWLLPVYVAADRPSKSTRWIEDATADLPNVSVPFLSTSPA